MITCQNDVRTIFNISFIISTILIDVSICNQPTNRCFEQQAKHQLSHQTGSNTSIDVSSSMQLTHQFMYEAASNTSTDVSSSKQYMNWPIKHQQIHQYYSMWGISNFNDIRNLSLKFFMCQFWSIFVICHNVKFSHGFFPELYKWNNIWWAPNSSILHRNKMVHLYQTILLQKI